MASVTKTKVSVFIATSIDGFIARRDGSIDWLESIESSEKGEDYGYKEHFSSVDALVMGRNTFEKVLSFGDWPYGSKPVIVLSKSLTEVPEDLRDRVRVDASSPEELIEKFLQEGFRRIYLDGGAVIQAFLRVGLVDEITLTQLPLLIGQGLPLFGELQEDVRLRHLSTQTWDNGFVQSKYEVSGK